MRITNRANPNSVALETTLLAHGVPRDAALSLAADLDAAVGEGGSVGALVGVLRGEPIVGMTRDELRDMLTQPVVHKANTANLGLYMHRREIAATTVSATMEIAAAAGVRVFATGGLGGVHKRTDGPIDISADLLAFTRWPVAVVTSGVKSILDVESTREALETLGVPVVGYRTDLFPEFYLRESGARVDARFDDAAALAAFVRAELERTGRGVVVCNPIPETDEIAREDWDTWLREAERRANAGAGSATAGRDATPRALAALHDISGGATLRANIALVLSNARLAGELAAAMVAK